MVTGPGHGVGGRGGVSSCDREAAVADSTRRRLYWQPQIEGYGCRQLEGENHIRASWGDEGLQIYRNAC